TFALCGSVTRHPLNPPAVHPVAGLYEPLYLLAMFGVLLWLYRRVNVAGYVFWFFVLGYAAMRAAFSPLRLNETKVGFISVPQILALATIALALVALYIVRRMAQRDPSGADPLQPERPAPSVTGSRTPRPSRT